MLYTADVSTSESAKPEAEAAACTVRKLWRLIVECIFFVLLAVPADAEGSIPASQWLVSGLAVDVLPLLTEALPDLVTARGVWVRVRVRPRNCPWGTTEDSILHWTPRS